MQTSRASDLDFREKERQADRLAKTQKRANDILGFRHNIYNTLKTEKSSSASLKLNFIQSRNNLPNFVCCSCEGLFFNIQFQN